MNSEFSTFKLGEVADIIAGGDKPKIFSVNKSNLKNVPVFANAEKNCGLLGYTDSPRIVESAVTVAARGSNVGFVAVRKEPFFPVVRLLTLIPKRERLDVDYLFYNLKQNRQNGTGSGQPQITIPDISNKVISLPSIVTQQKVAKVLYTLDAKIELNNRINAELEAMAKTLYDYWFVQFDFPFDFAQGKPVPNGKPYKSSGGKMVYNPTLKREIPEGWEVGALGEHISFKRGISYTSQDIQNTGVPFINLNSFTLSGEFKFEGTKYFNGKYRDESLLSAGDLVIAITDVTRNADIIGKAFIIPDIFQTRPLMSCDVASVRSDRLGKSYLEQLFNSTHYHKYIKYFASGTLVLHLDLNGVKWFKTVIPPIELLANYETTCEQLLKQRDIVIKENLLLEELRDWLLPMLMNGQVIVQLAATD